MTEKKIERVPKYKRVKSQKHTNKERRIDKQIERQNYRNIILKIKR